MTNKPMLSVKKFIHEVTYEGGEMVEVDKLPELCGSELYVLDSDYQSLHEQLELLRAFLDKPSAHHQGEPVAWRYKKSWEKTGWKVCDKHPTDYGIDDECYEIQALYAEQPAPVALVIDIESAAKKLAQCMDYPWEYMPEQGRQSMREHAKAVVEASRLNGVKPS